MKKVSIIQRFNILPQLLVLLVLLVVSITALAQKGPFEDVVYLKNGSVLRGTIVELDTEGSVSIQLMGGSVLIYSMEEVERITREPKWEEPGVKSKAELKEKGFFNTTEIGFNLGANTGGYYGYSGTSTGFTLQNVFGYRFFRWLGVGIGTGVDIYNDYQVPISPVYLRLEGQVLSQPITPIYYVEAGHGFMWHREINEWTTQENGPMWSAGAGVRFGTPGSVALQFTAGFKSQKLTTITDYEWDDGINIMTELYRRISLRFGITF